MLRKFAFALILIALGFITGYAVSNEPPPTHINTSAPNQLSQLNARIAHLEEAYQKEKEHRLELTEQLHTLGDKIQTFSSMLEKIQQSRLAVETSKPQSQNENIVTTDHNISPENPEEALELRLIQSGFTPEEIAYSQRIQDQLQLQQLYLRDQAIREGWIDSERYRNERRELSQRTTLREELGDERYDLYLYATEQFNRLIIDEVMLGSAAENSGIRPGDHILRYDNKRIFSWSEIREATLGGKANEIVTIEIERDKQTYQFAIPRGPLGVRLNMARIEP